MTDPLSAATWSRGLLDLDHSAGKGHSGNAAELRQALRHQRARLGPGRSKASLTDSGHGQQRSSGQHRVIVSDPRRARARRHPRRAASAGPAVSARTEPACSGVALSRRLGMDTQVCWPVSMVMLLWQPRCLAQAVATTLSGTRCVKTPARCAALQGAQHSVQESAAGRGSVCRVAVLSARRGAVARRDARGFAAESGVHRRWLRSERSVSPSRYPGNRWHREHCIDA